MAICICYVAGLQFYFATKLCEESITPDCGFPSGPLVITDRAMVGIHSIHENQSRTELVANLIASHFCTGQHSIMKFVYRSRDLDLGTDIVQRVSLVTYGYLSHNI